MLMIWAYFAILPCLKVGFKQSYVDVGMEKSSKAGPNDPYFSTSRMGRTVALSKTIFFFKKNI